MKKKIFGVAQYFYHCVGEELPIRDIIDSQRAGRKTEPHYENLTENWCSRCMNGRMLSANRNQLDYLFLMTRYWNKNHVLNGKVLIVGYLKRANINRWIELSQKIPSGVNRYLPDPQNCGFFAGDEHYSRFVRVEDSFVVEGLKNCRWKYFINENEGKLILEKLNKGKCIINKLLKRCEELKMNLKENNISFKSCKTKNKNEYRITPDRCR